MKIAWIVPGFQSDAADRCIPALTDLAHQVAAQHQLKVFALQYPGREDCYRVGAIEVQSLRSGPPSNVPMLSRVGPLIRTIIGLYRQRFDLVHSFWAAEPALAGVLATRLKKQPLVVSCMGGEPVYLPQIGYGSARKFFDLQCLRLGVRGARVITTGSEIQASLLKARFGEQVQPLVMPLGVDLERFQPSDFKKELPNQPLVLAVGSLLAVKGHAQLIEAIAKLPNTRLKIVGEGPERPCLQALIDRLNLGERVCLAGQIEAVAMPNEYNSADILALPSYYESQCIALLEGLACGLPVVAGPVGLAPQLLSDGLAGELIRDNTPAALSQGLARLLGRRHEWEELRQAARIKAASLSLSICSKHTLELYEALL